MTEPLDLELYDNHLRVLRNHRDAGLSVLPVAVRVAEALRAEVGHLRGSRTSEEGK